MRNYKPWCRYLHWQSQLQGRLVCLHRMGQSPSAHGMGSLTGGPGDWGCTEKAQMKTNAADAEVTGRRFRAVPDFLFLIACTSFSCC